MAPPQNRHGHRDAVDPARAADHRLGQTTVPLVLLQAVRVGLRIDEGERIRRAQVFVGLAE
jgi:hypothetical protein